MDVEFIKSKMTLSTSPFNTAQHGAEYSFFANRYYNYTV
jgi:hypothetical protein